jgi:hypothetical protein
VFSTYAAPLKKAIGLSAEEAKDVVSQIRELVPSFFVCIIGIIFIVVLLS